MKKYADITLILFIVILIALAVLFFNFKPDQISAVENRKLAEPVSIREGLTNFMISVEDSIDDRIGFRDNMMQFHNQLNYSILKANHSKVIMGDDGWLFFRDDLSDYTGTNIKPEKTQRQLSIIKAIDRWCEDRGITFILAVGPNKSTVYSNYMPDGIYHTEKNNADCLVELLQAEDILVSYPKEALIEHRDEQELYMRLDTHWNAYGAWYMMNDIVTMLGLPEMEFAYGETQTKSGDLLNMLNAGWNGTYSLAASAADDPDATTEGIPGTQHLYIRSENADKIVCYRDSFHVAMIPFYEHYFQGPVNWTFTIDFDMVEQESPKFLILSCVERYLDHAIESNAKILTMTEN